MWTNLSPCPRSRLPRRRTEHSSSSTTRGALCGSVPALSGFDDSCGSLSGSGWHGIWRDSNRLSPQFEGFAEAGQAAQGPGREARELFPQGVTKCLPAPQVLRARPSGDLCPWRTCPFLEVHGKKRWLFWSERPGPHYVAAQPDGGCIPERRCNRGPRTASTDYGDFGAGGSGLWKVGSRVDLVTAGGSSSGCLPSKAHHDESQAPSLCPSLSAGVGHHGVVLCQGGRPDKLQETRSPARKEEPAWEGTGRPGGPQEEARSLPQEAQAGRRHIQPVKVDDEQVILSGDDGPRLQGKGTHDSQPKEAQSPCSGSRKVTCREKLPTSSSQNPAPSGPSGEPLCCALLPQNGQALPGLLPAVGGLSGHSACYSQGSGKAESTELPTPSREEKKTGLVPDEEPLEALWDRLQTYSFDSWASSLCSTVLRSRTSFATFLRTTFCITRLHPCSSSKALFPLPVPKLLPRR